MTVKLKLLESAVPVDERSEFLLNAPDRAIAARLAGVLKTAFPRYDFAVRSFRNYAGYLCYMVNVLTSNNRLARGPFGHLETFAHGARAALTADEDGEDKGGE